MAKSCKRCLLLEAGDIVVDLLLSEHLSHIRLAGRISDKSGTAAEERYRSVAGELHTLHKAKCHEVTDMKAVGGRVETDVECCLSVVDQIGNFLFIRQLGEQSSRLKFFI